MFARKAGDDVAALYAAPAYLERIGNPDTLAGFSRADFIGFEDNKPLLDGLNALGFSLTGRNFPLLTASHLVHWELVKQGLGVGVMPIRTGDAEPLVTRALPAMDPIEVPVRLVAHRELRTSRRVRLVFDFLFDALAALPPHSAP